MTSSRTGLAILTAIALALGLIVSLDRPRAAVPTSRRLLPDLDPAGIVALTIARDGETATLARDGGTWRVTAPSPGPAAPDVMADLLGALELASAERWVSAADAARAGAGLDPPRVTITATDERGDAWILAIGGEAADGLTWAQVPGTRRAAVIAAWVGRSLDRGAEDLRDRAVVRTKHVTGIEIHDAGIDVVASGSPLRANVSAGVYRIAPDHARALVDALSALRFVSLPAAPPDPAVPPLGTVRVLGGTPDELEVLGPCPGEPARRWLVGSSGSGCVDGAAWTAVLDAARDLPVDPSPIAGMPVTDMQFPDGGILSASGGDWTLTVGDVERPADPPAVRELVEALRTPGRVVPARGRGAGTLTVTYDDGTVDELAVDGGIVTRRGEPYSIELAPEVWTRLAPGWLAVADRTLVSEEPTRVDRITARDGDRTAVLTRGATLEDWTADAGTVDRDALAALLDEISDLIADDLVAAELGRPDRTLTLELAAPPVADGERSTVTLELARPEADGRCRVRVDDVTALLTADSCAILFAPVVR